jgi:hypothetical protein
MKVLVLNLGWYGELGWMLDEAFEQRGLSKADPDDIEYVNYFSSDDPDKLAERGVRQMQKPGWSSIVDSFTLDYGGRKSRIIVYGNWRRILRHTRVVNRFEGLRRERISAARGCTQAAPNNSFNRSGNSSNVIENLDVFVGVSGPVNSSVRPCAVIRKTMLSWIWVMPTCFWMADELGDTVLIESSARRAESKTWMTWHLSQQEGVEAALRQQVGMDVGALSNKELKPLIEWLSGCVVLWGLEANRYAA